MSHCVKSFSCKIAGLYQWLAFQMALPDKTVGFTPTLCANEIIANILDLTRYAVWITLADIEMNVCP
jgi:hypothetical protein